MVIFCLFEVYIAKNPTVPLRVIANRTTASGYATSAVHGVTSISIICTSLELSRPLMVILAFLTCYIDYLPIYFQAVLGASPIRSGVDILATALLISPFALICGIVVKVTKKYRPINYAGWVMMTVGFGLLSLLRANSDVAHWVGYQILVSAGIGIVVSHFDSPLQSEGTSHDDVLVLVNYIPRPCASTCLADCACIIVLQFRTSLH